MAKCRPMKWVPWAVPGVLLPMLAAYVTTTGSLFEDVNSRAAKALSANESTAWAKIDADGRDILVEGTAPSQEALDAAVQTVAGTYGVRTVRNTIQIVAPLKMSAPTVESLDVTTAAPEIKGTWNEGVATGLAVGLAGKTYKLGENPELSTLAGNWTLKPNEPLAEGSYDVTVETTDGKETVSAAAPGKLVVDLPDPPPEVQLALPTIEPFIGNNATPTLKGTWPEVAAKAAGKNLQLKINDADTFVLGENKELTSDGAGNWQFVPTTPFAEGTLSVMPGIVGADGKWLKAEAPASVVIDMTPPGVAEVIKATPKDVLPVVISGEWPEKDGNTLSAALAGTSYQLGANPALTSDGKGNFTFAPQVDLAPGSYDVDINVADVAGNVATQKLAAAVIVPEPVKPATLDAVAPDAKWPYAITGSWDDRPGNGLTAAVAGRSYVLGQSPALTRAGTGKFSFAPTDAFEPGTYDVDFTTTDAKGATKLSTLKGAIVVPAEPVKVAAPDPVPAGAKWPYPLTGTWDERPGNTLTAALAGRSYVLGRGAALTSDGAGRYTFAPSAQLAPGTYDVDFTTTDKGGATQVVTAKAAIVVPELVAPLKAAAPDAVPADAKWPYPLTGTWDERAGNSLTASLAGRSYVLGRGAALTSDGAGRFTFAPSARLAPGSYDVDFTTTDKAGATQVITAKAAIVVPPPAAAPEPPPPVTIPAPTVTAIEDATGAPVIKGTWPSQVATKLRVTLGERSYELGKDANLNVKENNWSLLPGAALPNGSYDVSVEAADANGNTGTDTTSNELVVKVPPPPPPPPPKPEDPPYDCIAVMNRISNVFPIRFEFDRTDITKPFDLSVSQYAALLNDQRCTSVTVELEGHADFKGTEIYNMGLSERRAEVIRDMLVGAGVKPERLTVRGLGESMPLDPLETDEARMKNRRVQILAKP